MKLKISQSKNSCTLYVQKAYRDKNGKSTSKIVERLGSLEEVRARSGGKDPIEWAKEYVARLTAEEKEQQRAVCPRLHPEFLIKKGQSQSVNCGYLFLQRPYYKLRIDRICDKIAKDNNLDYDLNAVMEMLLYEHVINQDNQSSTHKADNYLVSFEFDEQQLWRSLEEIGKNFDYIQKRLYKNSLGFVSRDPTVVYYGSTNYIFETGKNKDSNLTVEVGMFIDKTGYPLAMGINPDNANAKEAISLTWVEQKIIEGMGVKKVEVCSGDSLLSQEILKATQGVAWNQNSIKTQLLIRFMSLLILRILDSELDHRYTSSQIVSTLRDMTLNILHGEGYRPNYTRTDLTDDLHEIAGFRTDTEFVTNQKMKRIISSIKKG